MLLQMPNVKVVFGTHSGVISGMAGCSHWQVKDEGMLCGRLHPVKAKGVVT